MSTHTGYPYIADAGYNRGPNEDPQYVVHQARLALDAGLFEEGTKAYDQLEDALWGLEDALQRGEDDHEPEATVCEVWEAVRDELEETHRWAGETWVEKGAAK